MRPTRSRRLVGWLLVERIVGNLEQLILAEGPETIAAFLAEPVTGASGVIVPPAEYEAQLRMDLSTSQLQAGVTETVFVTDENIDALARLLLSLPAGEGS